MKNILIIILIVVSLCSCKNDNQTQKLKVNKELWLPSLRTNNPQEGFELAIKLSRKAVKAAQPNIEVLKKLRPIYSEDANSLIATSQVVAINFKTIAAANNYWK